MSEIKIALSRGGTRLTAMTSEGQYVGSLDIDAASPDALVVLANALAQIAQQAGRSIQVAGAGALAGFNGHAS